MGSRTEPARRHDHIPHSLGSPSAVRPEHGGRDVQRVPDAKCDADWRQPQAGPWAAAGGARAAPTRARAPRSVRAPGPGPLPLPPSPSASALRPPAAPTPPGPARCRRDSRYLSERKARPDLGALTAPRALRRPSAAASGAQAAPPPPPRVGPHPRAAAAVAAEEQPRPPAPSARAAAAALMTTRRAGLGRACAQSGVSPPPLLRAFWVMESRGGRRLRTDGAAAPLPQAFWVMKSPEDGVCAQGGAAPLLPRAFWVMEFPGGTARGPGLGRRAHRAPHPRRSADLWVLGEQQPEWPAKQVPPAGPEVLRMFTVFRKPKTFKLRALHRTKKFGVAGRSYQEVLRKGCFHFQVPGAGVRVPSLAGAPGRGPWDLAPPQTSSCSHSALRREFLEGSGATPPSSDREDYGSSGLRFWDSLF